MCRFFRFSLLIWKSFFNLNAIMFDFGQIHISFNEDFLFDSDEFDIDEFILNRSRELNK